MDSRLNKGTARCRGRDRMKRAAQRVAPLGGAALVSIALLVGTAPTAAVAAPVQVAAQASEPAETVDPQDDAVDVDSSQEATPTPSAESVPESTAPAEDPSDPAETPTDPAEPAETPDPEPTPPGPTDPGPTEPAPTDPEPTDPQPTDPGTTDPGTPAPEPSEGESPPGVPTDPDDESSAPTQGEHYLRCGSAFAAPGQTQTLRLQMSSNLSELTVGSSLTGATIWIEAGVVYYQAPSPLPPGAAQDDFAVRGVAPNGDPVSDRCNIGLQATSENLDDAAQPSPPEEIGAPGGIAAPGTPELPGTPEASPSSASTSTDTDAPPLSGPPIPGMPGYSLPEQGASSVSPTASASAPDQPAEDPGSGDAELAVTGLSGLQTFTAVVLALVAVLAGGAAIVLAARRSDSLR